MTTSVGLDLILRCLVLGTPAGTLSQQFGGDESLIPVVHHLTLFSECCSSGQSHDANGIAQALLESNLLFWLDCRSDCLIAALIVAAENGDMAWQVLGGWIDFGAIDRLASISGLIAGTVSPTLGITVAELNLTVSKRLFNPLSGARANWGRGNAYLYAKQPLKAIPSFEAASAGYRSHGPQHKVPRIELSLVLALSHRGEHRESIILAKAVRTTLLEGDPVQHDALINLESNVSEAHKQLGAYQDALTCLNSALDYCQFLGPAIGRSTQAKLELNQGWILEQMGRYQDAEELFQRAQTVFIAEKNTYSAGLTSLALGLMAYYRGHFEVALAHLDLGENIRSSDPSLNGMAALRRSQCYESLCLWGESRDMALAARTLFRQTKLSHMSAFADLLVRRSRRRLKERQKNVGATAQGEQTPIVSPNQWKLEGLAALQLHLGIAEEAFAGGQYQQAINTVDALRNNLNEGASPALALRVHLLIARCGLACQPPKIGLAEDAAKQAMDLIKGYGLSPWKPLAHHLLSCTARLRGETRQAQMENMQALASLEQQLTLRGDGLLRTVFLGDKGEIYNAGASLCAAEGSLKALLAVIQLARHPPSLKGKSSVRSGAQDGGLFAHREALQEKLHALDTSLDPPFRLNRDLPDESRNSQKEVAERMTLERALLEVQLAMRGQEPSPSPSMKSFSLNDQGEALHSSIVEALGQHAALVSFILLDGAPAALVCRGGAMWLERNLGSAREIRRLLALNWRRCVDKSHRAIRQDPKALFRTHKVLKALNHALFSPIESRLRGVDHLYVSLPPFLASLPLPGLFDGKQYLIQRYAVSLVTSPTKVCISPLLGSGLTRKGTSRLILGDDCGGHLQAIQNEVEDVGNILKNLGPTSLLLGEKGALRMLRREAPKLSLLHLATHAQFREDNPLFSTLVIGGKNVRLIELLSLNFEMGPLIMLTACQTAAQLPFGEVRLGFGSAFSALGARGVVANQWRVPDRAAREFAREFYEYMIQNPSKSVSQAVAASQAKLASDGYSPVDWAGFGYIHG